MRFLVIGLLFTLFLGLPSHASAQRTYDLAFLVEAASPETRLRLGQLMSEISAVVGEDAVIRYPEEAILVSNYDPDLARANYERVLADRSIDLVLAFGTTYNDLIVKQSNFPKPVILFGTLNDEDVDFSRTTTGIRNFTYLVTRSSFARDLETFRSLYAFKRVGVVVPSPLAGRVELRNRLDEFAASSGTEYKVIGYRSVAELRPELEGVDAVYLAEGFDISSTELGEMAKMFLERKLPSFTTTFTQDVEQGWLASNRGEENVGQFIRRLALTVEAFVGGQALADMPVVVDNRENLTMNFNTAQLVGVEIPYSLMTSTTFVGEFKNVRAEKTYSIRDVIGQVLNKNLPLNSAQKDVALAEQDLRSSKSAYLPGLSGNALGTHIDPDLAEIAAGTSEFSTKGSLTLSQMVFSPDANTGIGIQKDILEAQKAGFTATEMDAVVNATRAYFGVLQAKVNVQIQAQNLEFTKRNLELADQNFAAGQSGRADGLRFRSQVAQDTQALVEALNELERAFVDLNQLMGNPITMEIDVEEAVLGEGSFLPYEQERVHELLDRPDTRDRFVKFLVKEALKNAPEAAALRSNLRATERSRARNGAVQRFLPTLSLQANLNRRFNEWGVGVLEPNPAPETDYNVSLNLALPIFDQNQKSINRRIATLQQEQLEIDLRDTSRRIEESVIDAVFDVHDVSSNMNLSKVAEEAAEQSLELTQVAYANGAVTVVELIDAQRNYQQAQLSSSVAVYRFLTAAITLGRRIGYFFLLNTAEDNAAFVQRFLSQGGGEE